MKKQLFYSIFCVLFFVVGCDTEFTNTNFEKTDSAFNKKYLVDDNQKVLFPRMAKSKSGIKEAALTKGQLVLNGVCLQIKTVSPVSHAISYNTLIWEYDLSYEIKEGIFLIKKDDAVMARLGD